MRGWLTPETDGGGSYFCRRLFIPNDLGFIAAVNGALLSLTQSFNWEKQGTLTPEESSDAMWEMYSRYVESTGCMIGVIFPYATSVNPAHSLVCDGSSYLRTDYPSLYAALDSAFITDADHFQLPDLRGRAIIGDGTGTGLSARAMGDIGGSERISLDISEIPNHAHSEITAVSTVINGGIEAPAFSAVPGIGSTGSVGGGTSHDNMMPWLALGWAIWAE